MQNEITKETRLEAYISRPQSARKRMILDALTEPMTARQIAMKLGFTELNAVRPRLTEMTGKEIEVCGKVYDAVTERATAVYKLKGENK